MMSLLIFLVILFGLVGVTLTQYISQYREAYALWINEIVFNGHKEEKIDEMCSRIESFSREICGMADIITVIGTLLTITFIIIIYTIYTIYNIETNTPSEIIILKSSFVLTCLIYVSVPILLLMLKIDLLSTSKSDQMDKKIFQVWYKYKCHCKKNEEYLFKLEPKRLYRLLEENIRLGNIENPSELEKKIIKPIEKKPVIQLP